MRFWKVFKVGEFIKRNGFQSITIMLRYARLPAMAACVLMAVSSAFTALQMLITKNLVDSIQPFIAGDTAFYTVGIWILLTFFSVMFNSSNEYFDTLISVSIKKNLTRNFIPMIMGKLKRIDYACFENPDTHNLISRMSQSPQSSVQNCFKSLMELLRYILSLVGVIMYFFTVSVPFTLIYLAVTVLFCSLMAFRTKKMFQMWDRRAEENRRMEYLNSLLIQKHPLAELRVLGGADYILKKWRGYFTVILNDFMRFIAKSNLFQLFNNIIMCLWAGFMLYYAGNMVMRGEQSVGFFVAVLTGIGNIVGITYGISYCYNDYVQESLSFGYFKDFMDLPETGVSHGVEKADDITIRFENVTFTYPNAPKPVLNGISFTLGQNERISIVGKNGAGKSTVIKLLCGLYKPDSGHIYIGGKELGEISAESAREIFSVVFQDFGQYSLTLRENIALGNIGNKDNDKDLKAALKLAMGESLLEKSELGLDMPLGKLEETGIDLSGGQWQRISIARAFFANSKFVILDEPTASLDPLAECRMYETFLSVLKNKGSITISHRLASAKMADRILVLDDGRIIEEGPHDELMKKNGEYCRMFLSQAGWYNDDGGGNDAYA